ncbi:hypothetical protein Nepgr_033108 [Nepenthes gracilis]|uniref:Uncharacterized protein n=1 Tax=Nepenthes gracilis TaxID=150966 RepID=A0AAD3TJX7_NEPGR|nr:hypothetical protein Nepgr_033108 [Nepenthes gracilis]
MAPSTTIALTSGITTTSVTVAVSSGIFIHVSIGRVSLSDNANWSITVSKPRSIAALQAKQLIQNSLSRPNIATALTSVIATTTAVSIALSLVIATTFCQNLCPRSSESSICPWTL